MTDNPGWDAILRARRPVVNPRLGGQGADRPTYRQLYLDLFEDKDDGEDDSMLVISKTGS